MFCYKHTHNLIKRNSFLIYSDETRGGGGGGGGGAVGILAPGANFPGNGGVSNEKSL